MPRTVAATDARRSNALPARLLRGAAIILILLEFLDLMSAPSLTPVRVALIVLAALACIIALWWPLPGVALASPTLVATWVFGQGPVGYLPLVVTMLVVAAREPPRVVAAVTTAYGSVFVARYVRLHDLSGVGWDVALLLVPLAIGLVVRLLGRRVRHGAVAIASAEEHVRQVRGTERLTLSTELSSLVEDVLTSNERALARALAATTTDASHLALAQVEESSRTALTHIRHLVVTLRGGATDAGADSLLELVEDVEDQFVGHGHPVQVDTPTTIGSMAPAAREALAEFVRAASDEALSRAEPGGMCELTLASTPGTVTAAVAFPLADGAARTDLTEVGERMSALGGSLALKPDGPWSATATVPRHPDAPAAPAAAERLHLRERWATLLPAGYGRLVVGLPALVGVVLFVSNALADVNAGLDWRTEALWALVWGAVGLAAWSIPASIVLALVVLALALVAIPFTGNLLPPQAAVMTIAAVVAARRPGWSLAVIAGWAAYALASAHGLPSENTAGVLFAYPLLGTCLGLAAHHFTTIRTAQTQQLQELRDAAATARDGERRQLAGELHDIVAYQLSLITVRLMAHKGDDGTRLAETISRVGSINDSARADLSTLVHLMRTDHDDAVAAPRTSDWSTPSQAARAVTDTLRASGHPVELHVDADADDAGKTTQRTISRVLREGTTNILRYAEPQSHCRITLADEGDSVAVEVVSQLPGQHRPSADSTGWGLLGLRERAALTGGLFTAGEDGPTWRVRAVLPRFPSAESVSAVARAA